MYTNRFTAWALSMVQHYEFTIQYISLRTLSTGIAYSCFSNTNSKNFAINPPSCFISVPYLKPDLNVFSHHRKYLFDLYVRGIAHGCDDHYSTDQSRRIVIAAVGSLFVTYLYNVMDGIFVGQGVGSAALGAVNIGVPFITFAVAIVAMFPMGGATIIAIRMGRDDKDGA